MMCQNEKVTFGGHLKVLRQILFRILFVVCGIAIVIFCAKDFTWKILLAPSGWDFCTYRWIESVAAKIGFADFYFAYFSVVLVTTDLSSQFMLHVTTAMYLGLLGASHFVMYELFRFVSPALYESEKKYSIKIAIIIHLLFVVGVLMIYFVLFPISFRFFGTYSVVEKVHSTITLDSYIDTFATLTLVMGFDFLMSVMSYLLGKVGFINANMLSEYRKHFFVIILLMAEIVTPPDLMTLVLVTIPLYLLYEVSIRVVRHIN